MKSVSSIIFWVSSVGRDSRYEGSSEVDWRDGCAIVEMIFALIAIVCFGEG